MVEKLKVKVTEIHRLEWVCPECGAANAASPAAREARSPKCYRCEVEVDYGFVEQPPNTPMPTDFVVNNVRVPFDTMVAAHYEQYGSLQVLELYPVTPTVCREIIEAIHAALTEEQRDTLREADWS